MLRSLQLLVCVAAAFAAVASKPNIIFFMADDLGWNNVQWHNPDMKTPNAAALLAEGIELDRHYAYLYCSPSRASLMSGRLPCHVNQKNYINCDLNQGVPRNMTFISARLQEAGYSTHHVGKWHLGMCSRGVIPRGRGFNSSLAYFEGAEDHFTQRSCVDPMCLEPINASTPYPLMNVSSPPFDFFLNDGPAPTAGTEYNGYQFNNFAVDAINKHDPATGPFFMYYAAANSHAPLEAPQRFLDLYPEDWYLDRRVYAAMCSFWDEALGNITAALKAKGMWDNTLLVFSSDNGGPAYWSVVPTFPHGAGANNWPLKGSKVSAWEGGFRVAAFVTGGVVPVAKRGTKLEEYIHMADWYATFAYLAGIDPTDHQAAAAGLPPIDSLNMWPLLSGETSASPRTEMPLALDHETSVGNKGLANTSALVVGDWKLLRGLMVLSYYQGPDFPNASSIPYGVVDDPKNFRVCVPYCLYNIRTDPTEQTDVHAENKAVALALDARLTQLQATRFQLPSDTTQYQQCADQVARNGNVFGPWLP